MDKAQHTNIMDKISVLTHQNDMCIAENGCPHGSRNEHRREREEIVSWITESIMSCDAARSATKYQVLFYEVHERGHQTRPRRVVKHSHLVRTNEPPFVHPLAPAVSL